MMIKEKDCLKAIYYNINCGKSYGKYYSYGFDTNLCLTLQNNIYWRHFGSSCNKNTLKDLKWIINTIFNMSAKEFITEYICK